MLCPTLTFKYCMCICVFSPSLNVVVKLMNFPNNCQLVSHVSFYVHHTININDSVHQLN